ncbi:putative FAD monooxygenase, partial [Aspergillus vadensis CBS 113365]
LGEELLKLNTQLIQIYEQDTNITEGVERVRGQYIDFMTGVGVAYGPNELISGEADTSVANNIRISMLLASYPVVG